MKIIISLIAILSISTVNAYDVHEWGTFTSLVGSNGARQDGMFYEDEVLPDFVHSFGEDRLGQNVLSLTSFSDFPTHPVPQPPPPPVPPRNCHNRKVGCEFLVGQSITQKMETPVLYFHSKDALNATVEVGFPNGIISQTFPAPVLSLPAPVPGVSLTNGYARFEVNVLTDTNLPLPIVPIGNIYGHARAVDANTLVSNNEVEKFIFYRGLGKFESNLFISSSNGSIKIKNNARAKTPQAFLVDTDGTSGAILPIGSFAKNEVRIISSKTVNNLKGHHQTFELFASNARNLLLKSLIGNGLNADEALAMVNTWEHGYFHTPGLRVLYLLHPEEVEAILPMKITPKPENLKRVFVGRIEVLTDVEENHLFEQILKEKDAYDVMSLGRFAPSIINRIYELAKERNRLDKNTQSIFDKLNAIINEKM